MRYPVNKGELLPYILLIWMVFIVLPRTSAQEVYYLDWNGTSTELLILTLTTCEREVLKDFTAYDGLNTYGAREMSFHPDGYLYMTVYKGTHNVFHIMRYHPNNKKVEEVSTLELASPSSLMAISEEGKVLLSRGANSDATLIYIYNLRMKNVVGNIDLPGFPGYLARNIQGIVKDDNILFSNALDMSSTGIWNKQYQKFDSVRIISNYNYSHINHPAIYYPACEPWQLISLSAGESARDDDHVILIDTSSQSVVEPCPGIGFNSNVIGPIATTSDFRQSALRIDLDGDNSSGHITAGYYDTLYTCSKTAPIADDDIGIFTCGAEVDSISFRLKYFDQPRLPSEYITAEGYEDKIDQTSPSRWVWQNPYGSDTAQVKEFLRSVRYHAAWDNPNERERAVAVTMHVGEDSTSSWSVYQLEQNEVFAGRDTTISYCPDYATSIELTDYLIAGIRKDGRIDPEMSGGGTLFTPGTDDDGDYLYILESADGGCADTAVLRIESLQTGLEDLDLDTVRVCPGQQAHIGLPPGRFNSIEWWDGNTEDSTWIGASSFDPFVIVGQDGCGIHIPITVVEQDISGAAGRDTTIRYCTGGAVIDLKERLSLSDDHMYKVSPPLSASGSDGTLIFDPAEDPAGIYLLIAGSGACMDTSVVSLQETMTQDLVLDSVRLCPGTSQRIGLEPGKYDEISWWNGESGDSTTIVPTQTGPFTVQARLDACVYQGEVPVTLLREVVLPGHFPDNITICEGNPGRIPVVVLDSIKWMDAVYFPGEEITISQQGDYTLRGYQNECYTEKSIRVDELADPSAGYSKMIEWCPQSPLTITLPEDDVEWTFRWEDGPDSTSRRIDSTGRYPFLIESDSCTFRSYYNVIESTDCDQECTVSIPNAITPNGDGINDNLEVYSDCKIRVTEIRIFDKWGGELYHILGGEVEASIWRSLPPGVVMVQVKYERNPPEAGKVGVVKTVSQGVLVVK